MSRDLPSLWQRLRRGFTRTHADADFAAIAGEDWPTRIMSVAVTDRHHAKQGRSIGRWTLGAKGQRISVYLKRHFLLPRLHGLRAAIFPHRAWSPGLEERENLNWVREQGIPAPRAAAAGQFVGPWGKLQGFIAVEELEGMLALHEAVPLAFERLDADIFAAWKRGLCAELARLAHAFHSRNAFHKDLYFCHFYIPERFTQEPPADWKNQVFVIDLHRLGLHRLRRRWFQVKDLARQPGALVGSAWRHRSRSVAILEAVSRTSPCTPSWIRTLIRWKWQLYRRHNLKRAFTASRIVP